MVNGIKMSSCLLCGVMPLLICFFLIMFICSNVVYLFREGKAELPHGDDVTMTLNV